jgi:hypothetical protein
MKISEQTLAILKNFATVNPSIIIEEGNVLKTMSPQKSVLAKATIPDNFERRFALSYLGRFINSVNSEAEVSFTNDKVVILTKDGQSAIKYGDEATIKKPPESVKLPTIDASCRITSAALKIVERHLGILGLPEIAVTGEDGKVKLQAIDSKGINGDTFSIDIGETDRSFRAVFKSENISKIIPGDYDIDICAKGISHFKGDNIEYWISVEAKSSF